MIAKMAVLRMSKDRPPLGQARVLSLVLSLPPGLLMEGLSRAGEAAATVIFDWKWSSSQANSSPQEGQSTVCPSETSPDSRTVLQWGHWKRMVRCRFRPGVMYGRGRWAESGGPLDVSLPGLVGGPFRKHEKEARRGGAHPCFVSSGLNVPTIQADDCVASNAKCLFVPPPPRWPRGASGRRIGAKYTRGQGGVQGGKCGRRRCAARRAGSGGRGRNVAEGWLSGLAHGSEMATPLPNLRSVFRKSDNRPASRPLAGDSHFDSTVRKIDAFFRS